MGITPEAVIYECLMDWGSVEGEHGDPTTHEYIVSLWQNGRPFDVVTLASQIATQMVKAGFDLYPLARDLRHGPQ